MKPLKRPRASLLRTPGYPHSLLLALVFVVAVIVPPRATEAGGYPAEQITNDAVPSLLPVSNARCLAAGDSGTFHLVWYDNRDGDYDIYYKYFGGSSWSPDLSVTSNSADSRSPSIALDAADGLHLVWSDIEDGTFEIYYKSYDGTVWGQTTKLTDGGASAETPCVAVDRAGNVHVVWREYRSGGWALYYRRFEGTTWSPAEALTPTGAYPRFPSIIADAVGSLHAVWQDGRISTNNEIYYRKYNGTAWEPEVRLTNSAGLSEYPCLTADSAGHIHVFWNDDRDGKSEIYHKFGDGAVWGDDEIFASSADALIGASCCADREDRLYAVWYSRTSGYSNGVYYRRFDGEVWFPAAEVASAHGAALNPCVASCWGGLIGFVWQDEQGGDSEVWWRLYHEFGPAPTLTSVDPSGWLACETTPVLMTGAGFGDGMRAWLSKTGEDSIPIAEVTALSSTSLSGLFDLGPAARGYWDVVIEAFAGGSDTLRAGFLVEQSMWGPDVRLTEDPGSSELAYANGRRIAADSRGTIHVVWSDTRDGRSRVYYKRCDGGVWGPDIRLSMIAGASMMPAIAVDSEDRLHVVWSGWCDANWAIYYKSYDGTAWGEDQRLTSAQGSSEYPATAADPSNNIYVVWQDDRLKHGNCDIFVKRFNGTAWGPDSLIYNGYHSAATPTVAADASGNIHVAWYVGGDIPDAPLVYRKFNGSSWEPADTLTTARDLYYPSISAGSDGSVHVTWHDRRYDDAAGSYEIFYKRFDGSAWGADQRLTEALGYSDNSSVVVAPDGVVHVVWTDRRWGNNEIYHSYFDGAVWTPNGRLTRDPNDSTRPSAACDADGNLHIIWQDDRDGNYEIYYKVCRAGTGAGAVDGSPSGGESGAQMDMIAACPNPATFGAMLQFRSVEECPVRLFLYDVRGRLVWSHDADSGPPGCYKIFWDGRDSWGRVASPGMYFAKATTGRRSAVTKIVVAR